MEKDQRNACLEDAKSILGEGFEKYPLFSKTILTRS